jgi:hypothetical protein
MKHGVHKRANKRSSFIVAAMAFLVTFLLPRAVLAAEGKPEETWVDRPMSALEASKEASESSHELAQTAALHPSVVHLVRTFDGSGENLLQEDFYDIRGNLFETVTYGSLTASMKRFELDADGHPKAGSEIGMDFAGNDESWYDWNYRVTKPGDGTIQYEGISDEVGPVQTSWYNTDGTLRRTLQYDPTGVKGHLAVKEYDYNRWGMTTRTVSTEVDSKDPSNYVSTEYLYDEFGNEISYNDAVSATGEKGHYELTRSADRSEKGDWTEIRMTSSDGTSTTDHYDYDANGVLLRHLTFANGSTERISTYTYYTDEEYDVFRSHPERLYTGIGSRQSCREELLTHIRQFEIPVASRPSMTDLLMANPDGAIPGTAEDHLGNAFLEAYEKNGIYFYVEELPEAFFAKLNPTALQKMKDLAAEQGMTGTQVSGRAVYYGDAKTLKLYDCELWIDIGTVSGKIAGGAQ